MPEHAVVVGDHLDHRAVVDADAAREHPRPLLVGQLDAVPVERDVGRELAHELRLVHVRGARGDDGDASIALLPPVAVRADERAASPLLGEAVHQHQDGFHFVDHVAETF